MAAPCCAGGERRTSAPGPGTQLPTHRPVERPLRGQVRVPGGTFLRGDHFDEGYPDDGERPVHAVSLPDFALDATAVTNSDFATFVAATGHVTDAERFGTSAVFHLAYEAHGGDGRDVVGQADGAPWWLDVAGATWRRPEGAASDVDRRRNHPVVHVSHGDALAYAAWAGKRLPTEAEWEYAARGGLEGARYAWGDDLDAETGVDGTWPLNIWQGRFPDINEATDGFLTTSPVKRFKPNGHRLYSMTGNVWEWCADWFAPDHYAALAHTDVPAASPTGPEQSPDGRRVMRGGSYLCHESYCHRYRVAARSGTPPDSVAGNLGFRCAATLETVA